MLTKWQKNGEVRTALSHPVIAKQKVTDMSADKAEPPDNPSTNEPDEEEDHEPLEDRQLRWLTDPTIVTRKGRKIGRLLTVAPPIPFPDQAEILLRQAYELGTATGTFITTATGHPVRHGKRALKGFLPADATGAFKDLLSALFWHGASTQINKLVPERFMELAGDMLSAKAQAALTQALLNMLPRDFRYLSSWTKNRSRSICNRWSTDCKGAMAVARVAYALHSEGHVLITPTAFLDTRNKIDLIVDLHMRRVPCYLCVQVKTARHFQKHSSGFSLMDRDWHYLKDSERLIRARMHHASKKFDISHHPIIISVCRSDFKDQQLYSTTPHFRQMVNDLVRIAME